VTLVVRSLARLGRLSDREWWEGAAVGIVAVLTLIPLAMLANDWLQIAQHPAGLIRLLGIDYSLYMDATRRFLQGGDFYYSWQYASPYPQESLPILYPPQTLLLFIPFTVLPALVWWVVPIAVTTWIVVTARPRAVSWPVIAFCLWWPPTAVKIATGNPVLWMMMFVALGTRFRWPSALGLVIKPSLAPLAVIDLRDPRWWLAGAAGMLPFVWLVPSYLAVLQNFRPTYGLAYSVGEVPILLIPIVAWLAREHSASPTLKLPRLRRRGDSSLL
jgi:hypothetical protein